jgi:hypothetical protein
MLLFDRIVAGELETPAWRGLGDEADIARKSLTRAVVVRADNVADYFYAGTDKDDWVIEDDIPLCAPVFPLMWFEFAKPKVINSEKSGVERHNTNRFDRIGISIVGLPKPEEGWPSEFGIQTEMDGPRVPVSPEAKWVLILGNYFGDRTRVTGPFTNQVILVNSDGKPILAQLPLLMFKPPWTADLLRESGVDPGGMHHVFFPALLALSFMHCRNVTVTNETPSVKFSRAHQRRHGVPLTHYKTLQIDPMKRVLETEGNASGNGLKKALHICRGHFKTFTADAPLFGKTTGTFWWSPNVRGSADAGKVMKDYEILMPS